MLFLYEIYAKILKVLTKNNNWFIIYVIDFFGVCIMKKLFTFFVICVLIFQTGVFAEEERDNYGYVHIDRNDGIFKVEKRAGDIVLMGANVLPEKYDSRDYNYISPVKRQVGNTCWAFAAVGALEAFLLKNYAY